MVLDAFHDVEWCRSNSAFLYTADPECECVFDFLFASMCKKIYDLMKNVSVLSVFFVYSVIALVIADADGCSTKFIICNPQRFIVIFPISHTVQCKAE